MNDMQGKSIVAGKLILIEEKKGSDSRAWGSTEQSHVS